MDPDPSASNGHFLNPPIKRVRAVSVRPPRSREGEPDKFREGDEREEEVDQIVHLFKMTAEPRDILMTLEQWQLMRKNNEKDDHKEIEVQDIDESEIRRKAATALRTKMAEDEDSDDGKKECIIF